MESMPKGFCEALKRGKKERGGADIVQGSCGRANLRIVAIHALNAGRSIRHPQLGSDHPSRDNRE